MIIDSDFDSALEDLRNSEVALNSPWLLADNNSSSGNGWSVNISDVFDEGYLTLDPKRYCKKIYDLRKEIKKAPHFKVGDIVDIIPVIKIQMERHVKR
jgi:type I restriction enzyme M protein